MWVPSDDPITETFAALSGLLVSASTTRPRTIPAFWATAKSGTVNSTANNILRHMATSQKRQSRFPVREQRWKTAQDITSFPFSFAGITQFRFGGFALSRPEVTQSALRCSVFLVRYWKFSSNDEYRTPNTQRRRLLCSPRMTPLTELHASMVGKNCFNIHRPFNDVKSQNECARTPCLPRIFCLLFQALVTFVQHACSALRSL